jgi:alanine-synthesizing transaminase|tara:strand:- start:5954 stop:7168 length:1215 start_codon:yes stop_codon:yes gene_type:complete
MSLIKKSNKLEGVCYDIRGPVLQEANRMEEEGQRILKLNIGNPTPFGFAAPDEIIQDVIRNLPAAEGYCDAKGLFAARKAVMQYCQQIQIENVTIDDVFMGNGVSELIVMCMQALINDGDEFLIPAPDYPLWTAAVTLAGGKAVHYHCDEGADWTPDLADIKSKINDRTRGILIINPNNPTGAVYPEDVVKGVVKLASENNLVLFADEIYDKILYDDAVHYPAGRYAEDILCISFNGLSKSYRLSGFRSGWLVLSGAKHKAKDFIEGLNILASMRLCANVPAQYAVQTALGGYQSINDLILPGGRLKRQRDQAYDAITSIPGVSCVKPKGAIYLFPKLDPAVYNIHNDEQLVLDFLRQERILVVQGSAFNLPTKDHLRVVFLPREDDLQRATDGLRRFLKDYTQ